VASFSFGIPPQVPHIAVSTAAPRSCPRSYVIIRISRSCNKRITTVYEQGNAADWPSRSAARDFGKHCRVLHVAAWPSGSCSRAVRLVTNRSWNAGRTVAGKAALPRRSLARTRARSKHTGRAGEHVSPWEAPRRARNATFLSGRHGPGHCTQSRLPTLICNATSPYRFRGLVRHVRFQGHVPLRWTPTNFKSTACKGISRCSSMRRCAGHHGDRVHLPVKTPVV
jgi:hypothetical protein